MNIFTFDGHLGRDAETKYTQTGKVVCSFSVPATSGWGDNKTTSWINCSLWGQRAESLGQYLIKGTKVVITGEFSERKYQKNDGTEGHSLECNVQDVVLAQAREQNQYQAQDQQQYNEPQQQYSNQDAPQNRPAPAQNRPAPAQNNNQSNHRPAPQHRPQSQPASNQPAQETYANPSMDFDDDIPFMNPYFREAILAI
jgi:single-strand DNA-binding protein